MRQGFDHHEDCWEGPHKQHRPNAGSQCRELEAEVFAGGVGERGDGGYVAEVLEVKGDNAFVHYDGYDNPIATTLVFNHVIENMRANLIGQTRQRKINALAGRRRTDLG